MSDITDKLDQIADGIGALPEALAKAMKSLGAPAAPAPQLPSSQTSSSPSGLNRGTSAQKEAPSLPGGFQDAKQRGAPFFGHTAPGRAIAQGANAVSGAWQRFKHGESDEDKTAERKSLAESRGGVQSRTQDGQQGEMREVIKLLTDINRNIEKMARQAGKYTGDGGAKTQLQSTGRQTQALIGGGKTQLSGGNNLSGIHDSALAAPSTKLSIRPSGAGGGNAGARVAGAASKAASILGAFV